MFSSDRLGSTLIIDDSNAHKFVDMIQDPKTPFSGGYTERDYTSDGLTTSYTGLIIPESDWEGMAREQEEREITLTHTLLRRKVPILDQNGLPYCWCYGVTGAAMLTYAEQGPYVPHLSATSVAAKVKGGQKKGGWAKEAIQGFSKFGCSTVKYWPEHELNLNLDTPEQRANAALHKFDPGIGYEELQSGNFQQLVSSILMRRPSTMGLLWWGHLVYGIRYVVIEPGSDGIEIVNSWGPKWENGGRAILRRSKAIAHEQISIRKMVPVAQAA